ncbi:hypothetical protein [Streptomyces sp. NPDC002215]|uniref:hypothetical protein n=1 Tax=Streptomyces sp. NPDC002215 TaxID=3154412 RepID=UPI00332CF0E2
MLDAGAVQARCVGDDTVRPDVVAVSGPLEQPDTAGEGRLRFYKDVFRAVAVLRTLRDPDTVGLDEDDEG